MSVPPRPAPRLRWLPDVHQIAEALALVLQRRAMGRTSSVMSGAIAGAGTLAAKALGAIGDLALRRRSGSPDEGIGDAAASMAQLDHQRIFELTPAMLRVVDTKGGPGRVNPAFRRFFGVPDGQTPVGSMVPRCHPDDRALVEEAIKSITHQVGHHRFEIRMLRADGEYRWLACHIESYLDGRLYLIGRDVHERRAAEDALRQSEARLQSICTASPVGIVFTDPAGRVLYRNPAYARLLGLSEEECLAPTATIETIHPEDREDLLATWQVAAQARAPYRAAYRVRGRGDFSTWVEVESSPVGEGEAFLGYTSILRDVTEERRRAQARAEAERLANEARQRAEDASRLKSEFLANMSHEIRTPMAAILGFADLLADGGLSPESQREHVATIRRNGDHLLSLISDILDLSKIEAGHMTVERIACAPGPLCQDVVALLAPRAAAKGLSLTLEVPRPLPETVQSDPTRLRQILTNLCGNAIKFTQWGGVRLRARCEEEETPDPRLVFDVLDTGVGMTALELGRLFRPFSQADSSTTRRFGGTGLGLSISKHLAGLLGGDITVESAPGQGSTFTLRVATGSLAGVARVGRAVSAVAPRPQALERLGGRVLVAEDGEDNRRLVCFHLRRLGVEAAVVGDGQAAVDRALAEQAAGRPFGAILMDMQMPILDGYGAAAELRAAGYRGAIIALTAHAMVEDREACLRAGCDDYLAKPVRPDRLWQALAPHLPRAEAPPPASASTGQSPVSQLRDRFLGGLEGRGAALSAAWAQGDRAQLLSLAHKLRGAAGGFDERELASSAAELDDLLREPGAAAAAIDRQLERVLALCHDAAAHLGAPPDAPRGS